MLYKDFLKQPRACPFCAPDAEKRALSKTESAYLTYALAPYHKHHLLAVPIRHATSFIELSAVESDNLETLAKTAVRMLQKLGYQHASILVREGTGNAKSIEHIHYHIIPNIRLGNLDHAGEERRVLEREEIKQLMSECKSLL